MLAILSPAKNMSPSKRVLTARTEPIFLHEANSLVTHLQKLSKKDIKELMHISDELSKLNYERYLNWKEKPSEAETKQALLFFQGMAYHGLDADTLSEKDIEQSQGRLRILSGLYGLLKPLDSIQAYRLEMGTAFGIKANKNLYEYWGNKIANALNEDMDEYGRKTLINLASNEYYKAVNQKKLKGSIITPVFKDDRGKGFKVMSIYAKKARGMMARFIIENQLSNVEDLQAFDNEGYYYNVKLSTKNKPVFTREH